MSGSTDAAKSLDLQLSTSSSTFTSGTEKRSASNNYVISDIIRLESCINQFDLDESVQTTYYFVITGAGSGTLTNIGIGAGTATSELRLTPSGI